APAPPAVPAPGGAAAVATGPVGHNPRLLGPVRHGPQSVRRLGRGLWATTPAYWGLCATSPISATPRAPHPPHRHPASATPTRRFFLTIKIVGWKTELMIDVAVIDDPAAAEAALEPGR